MGIVMSSHKDRFSYRVPIAEINQPEFSLGERVIRIALVIGFIAVLTVEAWLLLQAVKIWL